MVHVKKLRAKTNSNPLSMIMKKPLLILLLLFPFHGACEEEMFRLLCNVTIDISSYNKNQEFETEEKVEEKWFFDIGKKSAKVISAPGGVFLDKIYETAIDKDKIGLSGDVQKVDLDTKLNFYGSIKINRSTGEVRGFQIYSQTGKPNSVELSKYRGDCAKTSRKKKF